MYNSHWFLRSDISSILEVKKKIGFGTSLPVTFSNRLLHSFTTESFN